MKNHKVKALRQFNDLADKVNRNIGDEFYCTKERYEFLKENNAVELLFIEAEEVTIEEETEPTEDFVEVKAKKVNKKKHK